MAETGKRGFAAMDADRLREIARKGGMAAHAKRRAHRFTTGEARAAGQKGGEQTAHDRDHKAAIGRRGGLAVSQDAAHMARIGRQGGRNSRLAVAPYVGVRHGEVLSTNTPTDGEERERGEDRGRG